MAQEIEAFLVVPVFPPFSFRDIRHHATCSVIEEEHTHSPLGAAGKVFHVCHFLQVYIRLMLISFFSGTLSVSVLLQFLSC